MAQRILTVLLDDEFAVGVPRPEQLGQMIAAVGSSAFGQCNAGQGCQRAVNVDLGEDGTLLSRPHERRPPHDERNARSGFIQAVLATSVDARRRMAASRHAASS